MGDLVFHVNWAEAVLVLNNIIETIPATGEPIQGEQWLTSVLSDNRRTDGSLFELSSVPAAFTKDLGLPSEEVLALGYFDK